MKKSIKSIKKLKSSYRHGDLKSALLTAALDHFEERDDAQFTLRGLAKLVGVSHVAAYNHFASKHQILKELACLGFGKMVDAFNKCLDRDPADIVGLGKAYVEFAIANPSYFRVMFHPELRPNEEDPEIGQFGAVAFGILKKCIELNIADGKFAERNVDDLAIVAWSTVHGLAVLWVNGNLHPLPDGKKILRPTLAESVASLIVSGMLRHHRV